MGFVVAVRQPGAWRAVAVPLNRGAQGHPSASADRVYSHHGLHFMRRLFDTTHQSTSLPIRVRKTPDQVHERASQQATLQGL